MALWGEVICQLGLLPRLDPGPQTVFEGRRHGVLLAVHWHDAAPTQVVLSRPAADMASAHRFRAVPRHAAPVLSTLMTGDMAFDAMVTLFGDPAALCLLDDDTRVAVADAVSLGAWVTATEAGLDLARLGVEALSSEAFIAESIARIDRVALAVARLSRARGVGELIAAASTDQAEAVRAALADAVTLRLADARPANQISAARSIAAHLPDRAVEWLGILTRQALTDEAVLALIDACCACTSAGTDTHLDAELVEWLDRHQAIAVRNAAQQALTGVVRQLIVGMRGPERDARIQRLITQARTRGALVEAICAVLVNDQLPNASDWLGLLETDDPGALVVRLQAWGRVSPNAPEPIAAYLEHAEPQVRVAAAEALSFHLYTHLSAQRIAEAEALAGYAAQSMEFCRAAAHICVRARPPQAVQWLLAVPVDVAQDPQTAEALAEAFEGLRDSAAEPRLIEWLTADDPARMAAIEALAAVGTRRAVQPLTDLAKGFLVAGAVRRAARRAVETIEARVTRTAEITVQDD